MGHYITETEVLTANEYVDKLESVNAELLEALEAAAASEHHTHCSSRKKSINCNCHVGKASVAIAQATKEE